METAWPELSSARAGLSTGGQTEEGAPETSITDVAMGQAFASMSPAPSTARGATLEELLPQEGSAPLWIGVEPSWSLVWVSGDPHVWGESQIQWADWWDPGMTLFAFDDVEEERECESVHTEIGDTVRALTTMLGLMHDIVAPVGQV